MCVCVLPHTQQVRDIKSIVEDNAEVFVLCSDDVQARAVMTYHGTRSAGGAVIDVSRGNGTKLNVNEVPDSCIQTKGKVVYIEESDRFRLFVGSLKTFNDNAKSFADLNKNILQSWISVFTTKTN